jgi:hypothetical protein
VPFDAKDVFLRECPSAMCCIWMLRVWGKDNVEVVLKFSHDSEVEKGREEQSRREGGHAPAIYS